MVHGVISPIVVDVLVLVPPQLRQKFVERWQLRPKVRRPLNHTRRPEIAGIVITLGTFVGYAPALGNTWAYRLPL